MPIFTLDQLRALAASYATLQERTGRNRHRLGLVSIQDPARETICDPRLLAPLQHHAPLHRESVRDFAARIGRATSERGIAGYHRLHPVVRHERFRRG
jgi:hypothetical protein